MNRILSRYRIVLFFIVPGLVSFGSGCTGVRSYPRYPFRGETRCADRIEKSRKKIERVVTSYLGTPYQWGGEGREGIDCSGLIVEVFRKTLGIALPHSTEELFRMGHKVGRSTLCFGDLVFFSESGKGAAHVGIYLGGDQFVHASKEKGVTISKLESSYFRGRYIGARRIVR